MILLAIALFDTGLSASDSNLLNVSATATLYKPADLLNLSVGVVTEAATAEEALSKNNEQMHAVLAALQKIQLDSRDYFTGQFNFTPIYTPYPKDAPPNWTAKIIGYRVNNALTIRTDKLDKAGEIIDAVNKAGANAIDQIGFTLKDSQIYRQEAIRAATKNALQDAKDLAKAAEVKLGHIHEISLDQTRQPEPIMKLATAYLDNSTPITPGDVAITAAVSIKFTIEKGS